MCFGCQKLMIYYPAAAAGDDSVPEMLSPKYLLIQRRCRACGQLCCSWFQKLTIWYQQRASNAKSRRFSTRNAEPEIRPETAAMPRVRSTSLLLVLFIFVFALFGVQLFAGVQPQEREFFIDNLLVRVHFIIVMIRWTGLAPWEFELPFPGSLTSTFLQVRFGTGVHKLNNFRTTVEGMITLVPSLSLAHTLSLSHTHSLSLSLTHTLSLSLSLSHTHNRFG